MSVFPVRAKTMACVLTTWVCTGAHAKRDSRVPTVKLTSTTVLTIPVSTPRHVWTVSTLIRASVHLDIKVLLSQ